MKLRCEIAASKLLPTIRAMVAKELIEKYNMTQQEAATKLGITQSAVSQYIRQLRGSKFSSLEKDKTIYKKVEQLANTLASSNTENQSKISVSFCSICKSSRKKEFFY